MTTASEILRYYKHITIVQRTINHASLRELLTIAIKNSMHYLRTGEEKHPRRVLLGYKPATRVTPNSKLALTGDISVFADLSHEQMLSILSLLIQMLDELDGR